MVQGRKAEHLNSKGVKDMLGWQPGDANSHKPM